MSTDPYTQQATAQLATAQVDPIPDVQWDVPGWRIALPELNQTIDTGALTEDDARTDPNVVSIVVRALQERDPNYKPPPPPPAASDLVLAALDGLDPATATVTDVVSAVKGALTQAVQ